MAVSITKDQVISMVVKLVGIAGGYAVGKGYITGQQLTDLSSLIPQIITVAAVGGPLIYSVWANLRKTQITKVANMDGVAKVVVNDPQEASTLPSNVVAH